uniref:TM7S3/TM198-like domain-containing protein n=1 Tax=Aspergillus viridinutans TaxID=75553 RepID=A0A9P3BVF0_ASPVI
MRLLPLLALVVCIISRLSVFAASIPHVGRDKIQPVRALGARDESPTATISGSQAPSGSATSAVNHATVKVNSTTTSNNIAPASTTIVSLNTSTVSENGTVTPAPGALPLEPQVTPAFGVGGFILIATGVILALIGIRNSWVQVFLSAAFLTSLGVTVLIVYVMNPPVRVAVQGAYLVAIFFTGLTFGALSIVFKELTEGLGCLLGGFCVSMWLLCLRPGGLLTDTNVKAGFIGAISVAFYALSFSHHTRPYGLIVSAAVSGGTAVALGIDCYSRAGLKEFWLYIWGLNEDVFPLGTGTYPITRNIRVELAVTVIVAILGVVSQLRLWKVIREKRSKDEAVKKEEEKRKEEAEAEVARRLEENNMRERQAWEAQYADVEAKLMPELGDGTQCAADKEDLEKGDVADVHSISGSSQVSYRCSDCRKQECSEDSFSDVTQATGDTEVERHGDTTVKTTDGTHPMPFKVFDGAAAARLIDDKESDVTAMAGSDTATVRSKRFSGMTLWKRMSVQSSLRPAPSQEALAHIDDESSISAQSAVDDRSDRSSDCHGVEIESHEDAVKARSDPEIAVQETVIPSEGRNSNVEVEKGEGIDGEEECLAKQDSVFVQETDARGEEEGLRNVEGRDTSIDGTIQKQSKTEAQDVGQNERHPSDDNGGSLQGLESRPDSKKTEHKQSTTQADGVCPPLPSRADAEAEEVSESTQRQSLETSKDLQTNATAETADCNDTNSIEENMKTSRPEEQNLQISEEHISLKTPPGTGDRQSRVSAEFESQRPSPSHSKLKSKRKTEKPKLDAKTVRHLPERTSRVVQTYRTNEWAKHLCDAEIPEPEPIEPITKEAAEIPIEAEEAPAPVNVEELLQTPLTAQPPPAANLRASPGKEQQSANDIQQICNDYRLRTTSAISPQRVGEAQPVDRSSGVPSTIVLSSTTPLPSPVSYGAGYPAFPGASSPPIPIEQPQGEPELTKPRWKGPPPLLAVREDMMRSRVSSTCLSLDPWASRNSPTQSVAMDASAQSSPTTSFPESGDDFPLSRRRAMLHQQKVPSPHISMPVSAPKWSQSGVSRPGNAQAVMAAWRESIRENLKDKHNPLAKQDLPIGGTGFGSHTSFPFGAPGRNASSLQVNLDRAITDGMQRGDMSDLHREAMRRMQARANQSMNGR